MPLWLFLLTIVFAIATGYLIRAWIENRRELHRIDQQLREADTT